jgi:hypothetical protein
LYAPSLAKQGRFPTEAHATLSSLITEGCRAKISEVAGLLTLDVSEHIRPEPHFLLDERKLLSWQEQKYCRHSQEDVAPRELKESGQENLRGPSYL